MKFTHIRLSGFKSFVEPTEFEIQDGLSGVVGPNGCGKSNLVEALRWVMGENSPRQMRGGGMEDVIFAGTQSRPSRNFAEVQLTLDNADRTAPPAFNDEPQLVVSRRIERDAGSTYRINGREVRQRDVQLLFADLATGAHSPSMVSQGRVGAIINDKPEKRRALLEEAAGITGLHSRRHEAELRLRGAETNLERLDDVMGTLESQHQSMKRQARQAKRYRNISQEIRQLEAIQLHLRHIAARDRRREAVDARNRTERAVGELTAAVAQATGVATTAGEALPPLRQGEAEAAARLQRLTLARDGLEREEAELARMRADLEARIAQIDRDQEREAALAGDARAAIETLTRERGELTAAQQDEAAAQDEARTALEAAQASVAEREQALERLTETVAQSAARRDALLQAVADASRRIERLVGRRGELQSGHNQVERELREDDRVAGALRALDAANAAEEAGRAALDGAESERGRLDQAHEEARTALQQAEAAATRLTAEIEALEKLLNVADGDLWPPLVDAVQVEPGYETALGAALGDDLDFPADEAAPIHWARMPADAALPPLPAGARPLSELVQAPAALDRRLSQIGLVADSAEGRRLAAQMHPGQRLVTAEGALWRWDGFTVTEGAESAAAARLRQRNRLRELETGRAAVEDRLAGARERATAARAALDAAGQALIDARQAHREASRAREQAREAHGKAERETAARSSRLATLAESLRQVQADLAEIEQAKAADEQALADTPPLDDERARLAALREETAGERTRLADARAEADRLQREATRRAERLAAIDRESAAWRQRAEASIQRQEELAERRGEAGTRLAELAEKPGELVAKRNALLEQIGQAEEARNRAADALAEGERRLAALQKAQREAEEALVTGREERVRAQAGVEQAVERLEEVAARTREQFECPPEMLLQRAEIEADQELPPLEQADSRLERLKKERDRMGAVNLRAEQEAQELEEQLTTLTSEREDLTAAIARLRQGIGALNREGRERLLAAFEQVNAHFKELFVTQFGGGRAHLALIDSEDPLEAGLEIMASPPGKKLQTLSLLSGGEQAMTAMALLMSVFMTNPAPICVLDEVDAPLDDANVERFCNLIKQIGAQTRTRFMIITHHPYTMARMDRLFGVTMAERGVSQLLSVDLERAERLQASG